MIHFTSAEQVRALLLETEQRIKCVPTHDNSFLRNTLIKQVEVLQSVLLGIENPLQRSKGFKNEEMDLFFLLKFENYHRKYKYYRFNQENLETLAKDFALPHNSQKLKILFQRAKSMRFREKLRRKEPDNELVSILKTEQGYYLITRLLLAEATMRSVIKIIIPIIEEDGKIILQFSKPQALKVNYCRHNDSTKEMLRLVYGEEVDIFIRPTENMTVECPKSYIIFPVFPGNTVGAICEKVTVDSFVPYKKFFGVHLNTMVKMMLSATQDLMRIHAADYIHADVKASNMLCHRLNDKDICVRLIDTDDMKKTAEPPRKQHSFGTSYFHSDELRKFGGKFLSFASDVYALGLTFIGMLMPQYTVDSNQLRKPNWQKLSRQQRCKIYLQYWHDTYTKRFNYYSLPLQKALSKIMLTLIETITTMVSDVVVARPKLAEVENTLKVILAGFQHHGFEVSIDKSCIPDQNIPSTVDVILKELPAQVPAAALYEESEDDHNPFLNHDSDHEAAALLATPIRRKKVLPVCCVIS